VLPSRAFWRCLREPQATGKKPQATGNLRRLRLSKPPSSAAMALPSRASGNKKKASGNKKKASGNGKNGKCIHNKKNNILYRNKIRQGLQARIKRNIFDADNKKICFSGKKLSN
jgi:hypothetical protein